MKIDRVKLNKVLDILDNLPESVKTYLEIKPSGYFINIWPGDWIKLTDDERHKCLVLLTPLVGRMDKTNYGSDVDFVGKKEGELEIRINRADVCKIVGYKIIKETRPKVVTLEETETVETRKAITNCDIELGRFIESDIEVPA